MWLRQDFAKLGGRSWADRRLLVEAMIWLGLARCAILTIPFRWTTRLFALKPGETEAAAGEVSGESGKRIGWAVSAAAARSPWQSTCLAQALAGTGMLRRRGISATLAMGVAKGPAESGNLEAHAWLLAGDGAILTGADGHEKFNVIAKFTWNARGGS